MSTAQHSTLDAQRNFLYFMPTGVFEGQAAHCLLSLTISKKHLICSN